MMRPLVRGAFLPRPACGERSDHIADVIRVRGYRSHGAVKFRASGPLTPIFQERASLVSTREEREWEQGRKHTQGISDELRSPLHHRHPAADGHAAAARAAGM